MKNRFLIMIGLILIVLTIGAVSAADDAGNLTATDDAAEPVSQAENEDVLSASHLNITINEYNESDESTAIDLSDGEACIGTIDAIPNARGAMEIYLNGHEFDDGYVNLMNLDYTIDENNSNIIHYYYKVKNLNKNINPGTYSLKLKYHGTNYADVDCTGTVKFKNTFVPDSIDPNLKVTVQDVVKGEDVLIEVTANETFSGPVYVKIKYSTGQQVWESVLIYVKNGYGNATFERCDKVDTYTANATSDKQWVFKKANDVTTFKVTKKNPNLNVTASDAHTDENVVVYVKIDKEITDGVTINVNGENKTIEIKNGEGNYIFTNLAAGNYTYEVSYTGDDKYSADTKSVSFEVKKYDPALTISVGDIDEGSDAVVLITTNNTFSGSVSVRIGDKNYLVPITNGFGNTTVSKLTKGKYTAKAIFNETDLFKAAEKETTFNVKGNETPVVEAKIVAKDLTAYYNSVSYSVTVYGTDGKVAKNEVVTFKINGKKVGSAKTNANGVATIKLSQLPKTYKITSEALGKSVTKKLTVKQVLTLKKVKVKKSAKKLVLTATLKEGKKALKSKKITFKFKGKKIKTVKTNKKGIAKVTVKKSILKKLKKGKKVTYQATYIKDTVKRTVKVLK